MTPSVLLHSLVMILIWLLLGAAPALVIWTLWCVWGCVGAYADLSDDF